MNLDQDSCSPKNKLHPHLLLKMVLDTPNAKAVLGKGLAVSHICVVPLAYNCFPSEFPFQSQLFETHPKTNFNAKQIEC